MMASTILRRRVTGVALAALIIAVAVACLRAGTITTTVGSGPAPACASTTVATDACPDWMGGATSDAAGNVYFSERIAGTHDFRVRKLTPAGALSTLAGGGTSEADGAVGTQARLINETSPVVRASNGVLYVISIVGTQYAPRTITPGGVVATVAGVDTPENRLAIDAANNLYTTSRCTIVKYGAFYAKSVIAGQANTCGSSGDNGPATSALLDPGRLAADPAGNVYVSQAFSDFFVGDVIRKIDTTGTITRYAGNAAGRRNTGDGGPATAAELSSVSALASDGAGGMYVGVAWTGSTAGASLVRRVDASGVITRVAGNVAAQATTDGVLATQTRANAAALVGTSAGLHILDSNFYWSGSSAPRVQLVAPSGIISTVVGKPDFSGDGGPAAAARLNRPAGLAYDQAGNLFVADTGNARIRKVTPGGTVSTIAGGSLEGFSGDGGPATASLLDRPVGLAFDPAGNLYVADAGNNRVRMITPAGTISTVAGDGNPSTGNPPTIVNGDGGPALAAHLSVPVAVTVRDGDLYIGEDGAWGGLRRVHAGTITSATSSVIRVKALTVDANDRLLIAEGQLVQALGPGGQLETVFSYGGRGAGAAADAAGRLYVSGDGSVAEINSKGEITVPIGSAASPPVRGFGGDGGPGVEALLDFPSALTFDPAGNLVIADTANNRVRTMAWATP
jgi:hypothetical protein